MLSAIVDSVVAPFKHIFHFKRKIKEKSEGADTFPQLDVLSTCHFISCFVNHYKEPANQA
jgi:hypothetical protein